MSEASFCAYLELLKKESRRVDALSNEAINDILSMISSKKSVLIDKKPDKTVDILIERIHALEAKNEAMEPLVRQGLDWMTREKEKTARRQELMTLLSDLEWYEFEKRKAILEQLNTLG
jgi:replicative DNA helicase